MHKEQLMATADGETNHKTQYPLPNAAGVCKFFAGAESEQGTRHGIKCLSKGYPRRLSAYGKNIEDTRLACCSGVKLMECPDFVRAELKAFGYDIDEDLTNGELRNVLEGYYKKAAMSHEPPTRLEERHAVVPDAAAPQRNIADISAEIRFYKAQTVSNIIEIGKRLIEAKAQLEHGQWGEWLKNEVDFSQPTAIRFMRLAKEYSNSSPVINLPYSNLIALLSVPSDERESFIEAAHVVSGTEKTVKDMSKRELQKAIADYNAAKAEKEAIERELKEKKTALEHSKALNAKLSSEKSELASRLKAAESRPVDVAVREPNDEEKEALRREGYDRAKNELVVSKTTTPVAILEDPYNSFVSQIEGAVSALVCAVGYMPDNSGLSLLLSAKDVLCDRETELMQAYDKLMRFVRSQNPDGFDINF